VRPTKTRPNARLLTVRQASDEIGLPEDSIRRPVAAGDLTAVRPPNINRVYVDRRELDAVVDRWKVFA
jgi:hypothetical protein